MSDRTSRVSVVEIGLVVTFVKLFDASTDGCLCKVILSLIQAFLKFAILLSGLPVIYDLLVLSEVVDVEEVVDSF